MIGIGGGTASGKTTLAHAIKLRFLNEAVAISTDSYYRSRENLSPEERANVNYDHPGAIEFDLLEQHLKDLMRGLSVRIPIYDYALHVRSPQTLLTAPAPLITVEGILSLFPPSLRELYDLKIFVDTPIETCLERRISRDVVERGRTRTSVLAQWQATVQPMFQEYCAPTRAFADLVIEGCGDVEKRLEGILRRLPF